MEPQKTIIAKVILKTTKLEVLHSLISDYITELQLSKLNGTGTETQTSPSDMECSGMLYNYCDKNTTEHD